MTRDYKIKYKMMKFITKKMKTNINVNWMKKLQQRKYLPFLEIIWINKIIIANNIIVIYSVLLQILQR
jgi:hypothetical protein